MSTAREQVIVSLVEKWHARECDCLINSCPKRVAARNRAETVLGMTAIALERRFGGEQHPDV